MFASRMLVVPIVVSLVLLCSCRSVLVGGKWKPVALPIAQIEAFHAGEFEKVAAYHEVRRLASTGDVVVVWFGWASHYIWVKALRFPALETLGETLSAAEVRIDDFDLVPPEILRVVIIRQSQRITLDGPTAMSSVGESQANPILQPGDLLFIELPPPSPMWWEKKRNDGERESGDQALPVAEGGETTP